jgi:transposase
MRKVYRVTLTAEEQAELEALVRRGTAAARKLTRARILLKSNQAAEGPAWPDQQIADALEVAVRTVAYVRQRFVERGLDGALNRKRQDRPSRVRKLDGRAEARLIALACSEPPRGRDHWTLQLLADKLIELRVLETISADTVGRALKKKRSSPGRSSSG